MLNDLILCVIASDYLQVVPYDAFGLKRLCDILGMILTREVRGWSFFYGVHEAFGDLGPAWSDSLPAMASALLR